MLNMVSLQFSKEYNKEGYLAPIIIIKAFRIMLYKILYCWLG